MTTLQLLAVEPVHGWGWRNANGDFIPPPKRFDLAAPMNDLLRGSATLSLLRRSDHLFDGLWVGLSPRQEAWDGMCNVAIFRDRPPGMPDRGALITGYARVKQAANATMTVKG